MAFKECRLTFMNQTNKKIIIFDDDEDILSICSYILEEQGWEVTSFTDCNDIVQRVNSIQPFVILMDNWIPEDGGLVATQKIKHTPGISDVAVIYFSANSDIQLLAKQAGADRYLAKPFDLDDLLKIVESTYVKHSVV
jgi:two-component system cell cycle response regulator DivK